MASWSEVVASEPEFAARVQALFDAHRHKTMATLRKDGSPRISGTEVQFSDGEIWLGTMPGSRKGFDLRRDARLALHSASDDPPEDGSVWPGDAKLSGIGVEVTDPEKIRELNHDEEGTSMLFRIDIREAVVTGWGDPPDHLVIQLWQPGQQLRRFERK
jgi:hypothetical protein